MCNFIWRGAGTCGSLRLARSPYHLPGSKQALSRPVAPRQDRAQPAIVWRVEVGGPSILIRKRRSCTCSEEGNERKSFHIAQRWLPVGQGGMNGIFKPLCDAGFLVQQGRDDFEDRPDVVFCRLGARCGWLAERYVGHQLGLPFLAAPLHLVTHAVQ